MMPISPVFASSRRPRDMVPFYPVQAMNVKCSPDERNPFVP
jgi:hypothetical protein